MSRLVAAVLTLTLALAPLGAIAAPAPSASPTAVAADERAHDGGVIEGKVTNVDYSSGIVSVDGPGGKVDVSTMPSTSVQSDDPGYHTLTDVSRGAKVRIFISRTAGKLVAQIIHLIKH
ncbi:MAG: hypothetical protein NVS3B7_07010 [Candidatus Elarobacter sp.]